MKSKCEWRVIMIEKHTTGVEARTAQEAIEIAQSDGFHGTTVCLKQFAVRVRKTKPPTNP